LKTDKKKDISSSTEEQAKKKVEFSSEVRGNLDIKKPRIENLKFSGELNVLIIDADKSKTKILPSIEKSKAKIKRSIEKPKVFI
jgi:hypothetical protein